MAACFCGCGRDIGGLRGRANNEAAAQMTRDLAVMRGALERDDAGPRTAEVESDLERGTQLLGALTRYLHGEIDRDDLDGNANKEWLRAGRRLADALVASATGPAWVVDDSRLEHLVLSGTRAVGVVTDVQRAGPGNERVADLGVTVQVRVPDGSTRDVTRRVGISVVRAPRIGDRVEVAFDASAPDHFVFRPLVEAP